MLIALKCVKEVELDSRVIESDCLQLIQKLRARTIQENCNGLIIRDIVFLDESFTYFSWSFIGEGVKLPII